VITRPIQANYHIDAFENQSESNLNPQHWKMAGILSKEMVWEMKKQ